MDKTDGLAPEDMNDIYDTVIECTRLFDSLAEGVIIDHESVIEDKDNGLRRRIEETRRSFNLWIDYTGALAADVSRSLDVRLHEHMDIKEMVIELLEMLARNLQYLHENDNIKLGVPYNDDLKEEATNAVQKSLDELHFMAIAIRRSSIRSHKYNLSSHFYREDDDYYLEQACLLVRYLFPDARRSLSDQLGASLAIRRKRFFQKMRHEEKLRDRRQPTELNVNREKVPIQPVGESQPAIARANIEPNTPLKEKPVILPVRSIDTASRMDSVAARDYLKTGPALSTISMGSSIHLSSMTYPEKPIFAEGDKQCACPYCSRLLSTTRLKDGSMYWQNHIDEDTEPYICLSEDCTSPLLFFVHMKQWIDHMKAFHSDQWNRKIHMSTWYCDISHDTAIQFNDRENFLKHMKDPDSHPGREPPTELQLDTLSRKKHRVLVRENEYCCPMCDCVPDSLKPIISTSDPAAIKDRLYKHIAQHIKDLAFKSIPVLDNAEPRNGSSGTDGEERDHLRAENSDASYPSGFDDSLRETPLTFDENPVRVTTTIREEFFYDMEETNDTYLDDIGFNDYRRLETAQVWGGPDAILDHFAKAQQNPSPTVQPKSKDDFAIAICCVLPVEVEAVESLFDDIYGNTYGKQPADGNSYVNGRIGNHNVVLCLFPGPGKLLAARAVVSLRVSYPGIRLVLRVGICGGAPHPSENQQIFLGDILISDSLIAHDFGSQYPNSFVRKGLVGYTLGGSHPEIQALLNGLNAARSRRRSFERDTLQHLFQLQQKATHWQHPYLEDVLFGHDEKQVIRRRGRLGATPTVHIGTIASGDMVIKSAQHRDKLVEEEKVIGFVMEGIGMWESSPLIFVNGVCDYADSHKSKEWQYYAAASAASAAKALLSYFNPTLREDRPRQCIIPFARNSQFVGRIDEITKLEEWTMQPDGARRVALCGLGGVGKTQIVLELVYRIKDMDPERSIFWIPCTSHESVEQAYMDIAQLVGIQNMKPREIKGHVVAHFSQKSTGKWLFIFDGADDMDIWIQGSNTRPGLTEYLPYNEHGHLIFTSRNQKLAVKLASSHVMAISEPDEETSVVMFKALLIHRPIDMHVAMTIVKKLAFLPLAIAQAASYINETSCGISDYIDLLKAEELEVVELLNERFEDEGRYRNSESAVITTWSISFQQIQRSNQLAVDYLSFMACINPVNIPLSLLPQSASKKKMIDAIGLLKAYFFVREHSSLYLHPLVHLATRNWMRQNHLLNLSIHKAAHRLYEIFPDNDYTNRPLWRQYLHHALFFVQRNAFSDDNEQYVSFLWRVGKCLKSDGKYSEAGVVFGDIMRIQERTNGEMHSSTPISLTWLASTYNDQGRLQEALELNTRAMAISKRIFSAEHPDRLIVTANLASTYQAQGQLEKAIELNMQVMDIRVMVLGMEHPDTLNTMANLASIYREQGRLEEALELNTRAMAISKRIFSAEHPDRLIVTANLASTYQAQGQLEKAIELNMQVMDIRMRVLGREHPDTLNTMANLASIYREQGRLDGAAELDTRVIDYKRESAWN